VLSAFIIKVIAVITLQGRAMVQAVSLLPFTTEARVRPPCQFHVGFEVEKEALGQVILQVSHISPLNNIPPQLSILRYHLGDEQ
jgi:hypothetical protein